MDSVRRPWDEGPDLVAEHVKVRAQMSALKDPFKAPDNPEPHANARVRAAKDWKADNAIKLEDIDEVKSYHGEALRQSDQVVNGRIKRG